MNVSTIQNKIIDNQSVGSLYVLKQMTDENSFQQQLLEMLKNNPQIIAQQQIESGERLDVRV